MNGRRTNWWTRLFVGVWVLVLTAAMARPADAAGAAAEAEALIRQGLQLRGQGKPGKALPILEKAYQTSRNPRTAAHLGLVEIELGYFVEAEKYLTEGLASPDHPWISKNKPTLLKQLEEARAGIGELAVTGSPAGAEIWVNGNRAGQLPLSAPLRLDKGRAEVQVRAPGHLSATEAVTITGGKVEQRTFALPPDPAVAHAPTTPDPGGATSPQPLALMNTDPASSTGTTPAATVEASSSPPSNRNRILRISAWIAGGLAVGALAFGVVETFQAASARDTFNNHMGTVNGVYGRDCGTGSLSAACQPLKADYDRAFTLSIVGFAAGGALAAAATGLFLFSRDNGHSVEPTGAPQAFACVPDVSTRGLSCSLRF